MTDQTKTPETMDTLRQKLRVAERVKQAAIDCNATYKRVKAAGFPRDRFRLLCANCNQGRQRNGGVCPHAR